MTKNDNNYTNVLLEEIRSQMQAVLEISTDTREKVLELSTVKEDIAELKADMRTVKHTITDTNKELRLYDRRVSKLEEKAV